jgi:chromosome segregation protein
MALMFAIFKYRPSPFCLLDEIDAPLDDANVGRFVEMLRACRRTRSSSSSRTTARPWKLPIGCYGVTMEEPGVSKLISVQLN